MPQALFGRTGKPIGLVVRIVKKRRDRKSCLIYFESSQSFLYDFFLQSFKSGILRITYAICA